MPLIKLITSDGERLLEAEDPMSEAAETALDAFPDAVVSLDLAGRVLGWNTAAAQLLGVDAAEELGRPLRSLVELRARDPAGRFPERQWVLCGGVTVPVEVTAWLSRHPDGPREHLCLRNATQRVAQEEEVRRAQAVLRRQARFDALTGLANRYELEERLQAALLSRAVECVVLVVVDLDGFKPVNDAFGHAVGDEVLTAVAGRLRSAVRGRDTVARLGGDEFVVLTRTDPTDGAAPARIGHRVRRALAGPVTTTAGLIDISGSVGIAVSRPGSDAEDLLRRADKAMYRTKLTGGRRAGTRAGTG